MRSFALQPVVDLVTEAVVSLRLSRIGSTPAERSVGAGPEGPAEEVSPHACEKEFLSLAMEAARSYLREMPELANISVRVTYGSLSNPSFLEHARSEALRNEVPPERVQIHVTDMASYSPTHWEATFGHVHRAGFRVATDYLSAGGECFPILANPHINSVVCDQTVVGNMKAAPPIVLGFLSGLNEITRAVDKQLIVEGIDSEDQYIQLKQMGIPLGEGMHFEHLISHIS